MSKYLEQITRSFLASLACLVWVHTASAQRTPLNTRSVSANVNDFTLVRVTSPSTEFVELSYILGPRFQDKGSITHPARIIINGPVGVRATVEMQKTRAGVPNRIYRASFLDGRNALEMRSRDPVEIYAEALGRLFPGVTVESLRRTYSPEQLEELAAAFLRANGDDPASTSVQALAVLHKDACTPALTTYIVRLVIDLRRVPPAERIGAKVWGGLTPLPPAIQKVALATIGRPIDGTLNGQRFVQLSSIPQSNPTVGFVRWKNRPLTRRTVRRSLTIRHPTYGQMIQTVVPKVAGARKLTVEHLGTNENSIYSVCIAVSPKRQRINGFKDPRTKP